jgi:hypothetical protein
MKEVQAHFDTQQAELRAVLVSFWSSVVELVSAHNEGLPHDAPSATITACRQPFQKPFSSNKLSPVLTARFQTKWQSFGYDVAHFSSRSTGGEAGVSMWHVLGWVTTARTWHCFKSLLVQASTCQPTKMQSHLFCR